jgi:hypothetical protein
VSALSAVGTVTSANRFVLTAVVVAHDARYTLVQRQEAILSWLLKTKIVIHICECFGRKERASVTLLQSETGIISYNDCERKKLERYRAGISVHKNLSKPFDLWLTFFTELSHNFSFLVSVLLPIRLSQR